MSEYLMPPHKGELINGFCVDLDGTNIREDMLRISEGGGRTQIDIACLIPPVRNVSIDKLHLSLDQQLTNKKFHEGIRFYPFISLAQKRHLGFDSTSPRQALVVTYVIDDTNELLVEELSVSEAVGEMLYFSEFDLLPIATKVVEILRRLVATNEEVSTLVREGLQRYYVYNRGLGFQTTFMCSTLFNHTCRDAALREKIPFISKQYDETRFHLNTGKPKFNGCLRDPHAYVNASNLASYFSEKEIFFSEEYIQKTISLAEEQTSE
jgi:hypothetical protein